MSDLCVLRVGRFREKTETNIKHPAAPLRTSEESANSGIRLGSSQPIIVLTIKERRVAIEFMEVEIANSGNSIATPRSLMGCDETSGSADAKTEIKIKKSCSSLKDF